MPKTLTLLFAVVLFPTLAACQSSDTALTQRWHDDCVAAGHGERHRGLTACLAAARADHEADAFSAAAAY
jgi:hypothetical protein